MEAAARATPGIEKVSAIAGASSSPTIAMLEPTPQTKDAHHQDHATITASPQLRGGRAGIPLPVGHGRPGRSDVALPPGLGIPANIAHSAGKGTAEVRKGGV